MQWTACSCLMAQHYPSAPRLARAMTVLSLSSTSGALFGKLGGAAILQYIPNWRILCLSGSVMAAVGSLVMKLAVAERPAGRVIPPRPKLNMVQSLRGVMGSPLFWAAAFAHGMVYLARSSDRVLGSFFADVAGLSGSVGGLLTACVTLGLVHGLRQANQFMETPQLSDQMHFLRRKYLRAALCTLGLGAVAQLPMLPSWSRASLAAGLAGSMASSLAVAFFQIPPQIGAVFGPNRPVCIALMDAGGFFTSALVWGLTGRLVSSWGTQWGWMAAFGLVGGLFGLAGQVMLRLYPQVVQKA